MALIPYETMRHLNHWTRDLDRFFDNFPAGFGLKRENAYRMDVYETETEVVASCEIPGLDKKEDVQIEVEGNVLTIHGTIHKTHEVEENELHHKERYTGRFHRSVTLPVQVEDEGTKATYRNGILEIRMPKAKVPNKKQIDVEFH